MGPCLSVEKPVSQKTRGSSTVKSTRSATSSSTVLNGTAAAPTSATHAVVTASVAATAVPAPASPPPAGENTQSPPGRNVEVSDVRLSVEVADIRQFGFDSGFYNHYELTQTILGTGSYGVVLVGINKATQERVAVKKILKSKIKSQRDHRELLLEVDILNRIGVGSLNCISLYDTFEDELHVYLVLELAEGGTLLRLITKMSNNYLEEHVVRVTRSILQMVAQLHVKHIIHRDIKIENFVFTSKKRDAALKAIDFGLAVYHPPGSPNLKDVAGTPYYLAPEVIQKNYSFAADLWSVGALVYMLLSGERPFVGDRAKHGSALIVSVIRSIRKDELRMSGSSWDQVSDLAKDFVKRLLVKDPNQRMTVEQALDHPWLDTLKVVGNPRRLSQTVVARLQRYSTYGAFKRKAMVYIIRRNAAASSSSTASRSLNSSEAEEHLKDNPAAEHPTGENSVLSRYLPHFFENDPKAMLLTQFFHLMDKDGNHLISVDEAQTGLMEAGYELSEQEATNLWATVDVNSDGGVDIEEFMAALLDWGELEATLKRNGGCFEELMRCVFDHFDSNKDGILQVDELARVLDRDAKSPEVRALLTRADMNGDGTIDYEEFLHVMRENSSDKLDLYDLRLAEDVPSRFVDNMSVSNFKLQRPFE